MYNRKTRVNIAQRAPIPIEPDTFSFFYRFHFRLSLDVTWSETGDRYMLKLFRDYLFHTVTENGQPWLDHAHIIQCLNKLDAGIMEKVRKPFDSIDRTIGTRY